MRIIAGIAEEAGGDSPPAPNSGGVRGQGPSFPKSDSPRIGGRGVLLSLALTALSGLLLAGALPPLDWGGLAWVGLIPFLRLFPFRSGRAAFGHGMALGVCYLGVMAYWIVVFAGHLIGPALSLLGWALVTAYQAFYLGIWALGAQWLKQHPNPWAWRLGVPALWAAVEWWRQAGTLGLGWGDLAYTQHLALPVLQITKLTGIWGLAFLIVLVNTAGATHLPRFAGTPPETGGGRGPDTEIKRIPDRVSFSSRFGRSTREAGEVGFPLLTAALLLAALAYGFIAIHAEHLRPSFTAAALQGNIDQNVPQDPAYTARVTRTFVGQSREAARRGTRLVVWPETAYPGFLQSPTPARQAVAAEAVQNRQAALIGGVEYDAGTRKNANSLFVMDVQGRVTGSYQKRQLVPFGEFVPGRRWLPSLEALHVTGLDMQAGADTQPLLDGGPGIGKIGATICFESSYPRFLREQVARGAGLLVVSTDDTWFGRTAAARQHSAIAAVRACEADRYLVRSAATGISQVIDPTGRVLAEADLFRPAVVSAPVEPRTTRTLFVRWGDWFAGACLAAVCAFLPGGLNARVRRAGTSRSSGR